MCHRFKRGELALREEDNRVVVDQVHEVVVLVYTSEEVGITGVLMRNHILPSPRKLSRVISQHDDCIIVTDLTAWRTRLRLLASLTVR